MAGIPKRPVVVIGSINTDLVVTAPRIVRPGETIHGTGFDRSQGGKGANQAVSAASAGADVLMFGRVGGDENGGDAVAALTEAGVDAAGVSVVSGPTGVALIQVSDDGENAITIVAGANGRLTPDDVDQALVDLDAQRPGASAVVVLCLELPLPTVEHAARMARERGHTVVLNPAPAPRHPLSREFLDAVDVLVPNITEVAAVETGGAVNAVEAAEAAGAAEAAETAVPPFAEDAVPRDPQASLDSLALVAAHRLSITMQGAVVLTRGAKGASVFRSGERTDVPAPAVTPIDSTGAGDAFIGVLAASLAEGLDLTDAVGRATRAGAIATLGRGARGRTPPAE